MKKYRTPVNAAAASSGTTFYQIQLRDVIPLMENCILEEALREYGWGAIDIDQLFGSVVDDKDVLWLCVSDGEYIIIDGTEYDPYYILEEEGTSIIPEEYIKPGNRNIIKRYITEYEMKKTLDFEQIVINLLNDGVSLYNVVNAIDDADIFR